MLSRLYNLREAGVSHGPTGKPKKKRTFKKAAPDDGFSGAIDDDEPEWDEDAESDKAFGGSVGASDASWQDDDSSDDDLGPDLPYEDPTPEDDEDDAEFNRMFGHMHSDEPKPEPKAVPFASKSQPPSKALQGGKTALTLSGGDKKTLGALQKALESVRTKDDDLADWIDDCVGAISRAMKKGGDCELPKFEATPALDDFDDDGGTEEDF